jgi:hypothetical protein
MIRKISPSSFSYPTPTVYNFLSGKTPGEPEVEKSPGLEKY